MNCKPGELAIVIASKDLINKKIGLVVRILERANVGIVYENVWSATGRQIVVDSITWLVILERTGQKWLHADCRLRPIRPGDLEDEMPTARELEAM